MLAATGTVQFSAASSSHLEAASPSITVTLTTNNADLDGAVTVNISAAAGTATTADFTLDPSSVTFNTVDSYSVVDSTRIYTKSLPLSLVDDRRLEGDESFSLSLGAITNASGDSITPGAVATHTATITDDETGVINFLADASAAESSNQTQTATLTITGTGTGNDGLDVQLTVEATVAAAPNSGTATSGTDYTAYGSKTLTFAVSDVGTSVTSITSTTATLEER